MRPYRTLDVDRGKEATNSNESKRILALNGWYQYFPVMIGSLMSDVLNPEGVTVLGQNFFSGILIARNCDVFVMDHQDGGQLAGWRNEEGWNCGLIFLSKQCGL